jgi:hypothetical protein
MERRCGECTLCCTLLPVRALDKGASERCKHQRGLGCKVYHDKKAMPLECQLWNCRWLIDPTTTKMLRPDISHYVIDIMPDFITARADDGREIKQPVIQVWCDPRYPDAHKDPAFREWMRQHEPQCAVIVRYNAKDAIILIPPHMSTTGEWEEPGEEKMQMENRTHRVDEIAAVLTNSGAMK